MCVNVASDALGVVDDYLLMTRHESEFGGEAYQEGTEKATGLQAPLWHLSSKLRRHWIHH